MAIDEVDPARAPIRPDLPTITVCRGCCCGTEKKHPGVDHAARLDQLREFVGTSARVRTSECLGPCERADVIAVGPSRAARRAGARAVWVGRITSERVLSDLAGWTDAGGPGLSEAPASVAARTFRLERVTSDD